MDHVVRYRSADGERWEDVAGLDAAVARVEALHNAGGAQDIRVYRQVPIEVRTYVKVEVVDAAAPAGATVVTGAAPTGSAAEPPPGAMPLNPSPPRVEEPAVADDAPGEGRRIGLFNR